MTTKIRNYTPLRLLKKDTLIDLLIHFKTLLDMNKECFDDLKQIKFINERLFEKLKPIHSVKNDIENCNVLVSDCFYQNLEMCSHLEDLVKTVRCFITEIEEKLEAEIGTTKPTE